MIRQKSNSLSLRTGQMFLFAALSITIMLMAILCSIKIIREHQVSYDNQTIMTYDARYSEQSQFGRNSFLGVEDRNQLSYFDAFMRRLADGALHF